MLLAELEDPVQERELSMLWSEVMSAAFFDPSLREQLAQASERWSTLVADAVWRGQEDGSIGALAAPDDLAALLTAAVDGISARWLAGLITRERARELLAMSVASLLGIHRRGGHSVSGAAAFRAVVQGKVQGVAFRDAAVRRAQALGVLGWVRNDDDGTVLRPRRRRARRARRVRGMAARGPGSGAGRWRRARAGQGRGP